MVEQALILAAGLGSRLHHMTQDIPKALVKAKGIPILKRQIDSLFKNNIEEINIVCGYKKEIILDFIHKEYKSSVIKFNFISNDNFESTNSAYSFWLANEYIGARDFIHMNCDNIFGSNVINALLNNPAKNVIVGRKQALSDNMEQVELDSNNMILRMDNKQFDEATMKAMGVAKISTELCSYLYSQINDQINAGDTNTNFYGAIREAVSHYHIYSIDLTDQVFEINTLDEYEDMHS